MFDFFLPFWFKLVTFPLSKAKYQGERMFWQEGIAANQLFIAVYVLDCSSEMHVLPLVDGRYWNTYLDKLEGVYFVENHLLLLKPLLGGI